MDMSASIMLSIEMLLHLVIFVNLLILIYIVAKHYDGGRKGGEDDAS